MPQSQETQALIDQAFASHAQADAADQTVTGDEAAVVEAHRKMEDDTASQVQAHQQASADSKAAIVALAQELGYTLPG